MLMLSGNEIKKLIEGGELVIEPFDEEIVRENGVDLRIGSEVAVLLNNPEPMDPEKLKKVDLTNYYKVFKTESFILQPYMKVLVTTLEYIKMPVNVAALVAVRSTFARLGVSIPPTLIDAGFEGEVTIEIHGGAFPVVLRKGTRFAHIAFFKVEGEPIPYKGKYQRQRGVTLPR